MKAHQKRRETIPEKILFMKNTLRNLNESRAAVEATKLVSFYCAAPMAQLVELVGDFNQWHPLPMERWLDGWWRAKVPLQRGSHQYFFRIDGRPSLDSCATGIGHNDHDETVSCVAVG